MSKIYFSIHKEKNLQKVVILIKNDENTNMLLKNFMPKKLKILNPMSFLIQNMYIRMIIGCNNLFLYYYINKYFSFL